MKNNGDIRLVADYRRINEKITANAWPIPNMNTAIANLANQAIFSTLDIREAFYGVELSPESIQKSAIITPWGLFEYLRSNFGLKDSMKYYCQMISIVLGHLSSDQVLHYVDDCICLGKTVMEHLKNLDDVLSSLANNGIILQIKKCKLFREETKFLGHQISKNGIKPIKKNLEAILNIKNPDNLKKVRSLVGKFNYYAKFILKHAENMAPLSELIKGHSEDKKETPITLTKEAIKAIDIMKAKLTQAPILAYPNFY